MNARPILVNQKTAAETDDDEEMKVLRRLAESLDFGEIEKPKDPYQIVEPENREVLTAFGTKHLRVPNHLYFVRCGNFVKIGIAADVRQRVRSMENGNPHEMEILHVMPGKRKEEKELHQRFSAYRHRDEWFRFEGELEQYIKELANVGPEHA